MAKAGNLAAPDGCTFWSDGHLCERPLRHCDQCMCKCGHRWHRPEGDDTTHTVTVQLGGLSPELESAFADFFTEEIERRRRRDGDPG